MKGLVLLDENNKSELNNKVSDIQERLDEMAERLGMIAHNTAVWNRESRSIMVESINESLEKMFGRIGIGVAIVVAVYYTAEFLWPYAWLIFSIVVDWITQ